MPLGASRTDRLALLFTSAGRRVELLRAFRQAFQQLGVAGKIIVADIDPLAPAFQVADVGYLVPPVTNQGYVTALADICQRESVRLIFPLIDPDIPVLARGRDLLEATGARLVALAAEQAEQTFDKLATIELFDRLDVPHPPTWPAEQAPRDELRYPAFVKPRFGSAGKHAFRAESRQGLESLLGYVPDPVVQEFVDGPEITSDVTCSLEGEVWAVVSRRRIEVRWGEVAKGVTEHDPEILRQCVTIARGLQAVGPITVQCLRGPDGPRFTEVNARFGGGVPLGIAAGVPSPAWYVAEASGLPVTPPALGEYRTGLYLTRYDSSYFLSESDVARIESRRL
ncbi:MAG: ATP-grasp domain-containing protein [Anaerolineales bacterium]